MAEIRTTKETYIETTGKKSYPVEVTRLRSDEPWEYEVAPGQWKLVDAVTIFDAGIEALVRIDKVDARLAKVERLKEASASDLAEDVAGKISSQVRQALQGVE